ncbi:MAG: sensor histidine kinase [Rhodospirillales bacterium]
MTPQPQRSPLTLIAGAVTVAFLIFAGFVIQLLWQTDSALEDSRYDESGLGAVELRLFHARLIKNMHDLETESHGATIDEVLLSYDVLYERVQNLPDRPPYPEILDGETKALLTETFVKLDSFAPVFDKAAETGDAGPIAAIAGQIENLAPALQRISGRSEQLGAEFSSKDREQGQQALALLTFALIGLMMSSLMFAGLMWRSLRIELERARELVAARDEAIRASQAKSEFLAHMSHDLRTPLNAIIGFSDIIHSQTFGPLMEKYVDYASYVKSAGEQLLILINKLLDLSRIEAKRMDLAVTHLRMESLFRECADMAALRARQRNVRITRRDETDGYLLEADPGKLTQMIINLLDNAIRFSPEGGAVRLGAAVNADGEMTISVSDDGAGIAEEDIAKALEPFGQIEDRDPKVANQGAGLGLPIVKALAELHGGGIKINSGAAKGTSVVLTFPPHRVIAESKLPSAAAESQPQPA